MTTPGTPSFPLSELPAGTLIGPAGRPLMWVGDAPAGPGDWARYGEPARSAGLLPVLLADDGPWGPGWWTHEESFRPGRMSAPDDHHAEVVLRENWARVVPDEEEGDGEDGAGLIAPFGRSWAGLAEPGPAGGD
ncbi:hypothetical protein ACM614_06335, partial [Streptomyces sp. 12297]